MFNNINVLIVEANRNGDIEFLKEKEFNGEFNPTDVTEPEGWNWLHSCNLLNPSPPKTINFYIEKGVDINAQDMYGMTPLHYAMRIKNLDAIKTLLEAGANPNIPNEDGITALNYINGMPKELDLLKLMLEKGANPNHSNGQHGILEGIKKYRSDEPEFIPVIAMMEKYI